MQSVVTLSVNMKSVTMPNVSFLFDMQSVVMLNVDMQSIIKLIVVMQSVDMKSAV